jgi:DNA-directed RNA polymerase subunit RPC12/RpoP
MIQGIKCKDCGKRFILKDEQEYILSYCEGCNRLVVIYKINPAILVRINEETPIFVSSDGRSRCRRCGNQITIKNNKDYYSLRCTSCGFGIIYRMSSHKGVSRFISGDKFDKTVYWTTGKRKAERERKEAEYGK